MCGELIPLLVRQATIAAFEEVEAEVQAEELNVRRSQPRVGERTNLDWRGWNRAE